MVGILHKVERYLKWVWISPEVRKDQKAFSDAKKYIVAGIDTELIKKGYIRIDEVEFREWTDQEGLLAVPSPQLADGMLRYATLTRCVEALACD